MGSMNGWIDALALGGGLLVASWVLLVVLAARLPPGVLRELAGFLPNCVNTARTLRRDPAVPRRAKVAVCFAAPVVPVPIDLIPELLPVIGPLDDVVVVALALRYAARRIPREVLEAAWKGDPSTLDRLPGRRRRRDADDAVDRHDHRSREI
jgi:uncharacterized membrane protein YkvA (DUF1232 family)